jgi:decaprenyl-phosphate phosphoribosyltransferase
MPDASYTLKLIRPHHYIKNGFIFLPPLFAGTLTHLKAALATTIAFVAFCLLASSVYVLNDLNDVSDDREHPQKRNRPIASGKVSQGQAIFIMSGLLLGAFGLALALLPVYVAGIMASYYLLNVFYSLRLKRIPVVDIVCIAIGFLLRILAGGEAAGVVISPWIVIMTFLIALFLGLAKRNDDLLLANQGHHMRKAIDGYNAEFISLAMGVMASVIIVAYILYTVSPEVIARYGRHMYSTSLWVVLGLLRYLQITYVNQKSGSPTMILLKDRSLQAVVLLWLTHVIMLVYG